ncbi:hypothetical protein [Nocardia vaccinii]|uniref:hypothetical protein n=1 Tax=Nocardia vaccinii TaxID=1822 RepID=UPI000ABCD953|nr:hypothetical protein [Nocardia vaccinii]
MSSGDRLNFDFGFSARYPRSGRAIARRRRQRARIAALVHTLSCHRFCARELQRASGIRRRRVDAILDDFAGQQWIFAERHRETRSSDRWYYASPEARPQLTTLTRAGMW